MRHITCKDCENEYEATARRCPHCGAKKPINPFLIYSAVLAVLLLLATKYEEPTRASEQRQTAIEPHKSAKDSGITIDKSKVMQAERLSLINKLIKKGIFKKIEKPATLPRVWVEPAFYILDYKMKNRFVGVVYAYYYADQAGENTVRVMDALSGEQVGTYSVNNPGLKMER